MNFAVLWLFAKVILYEIWERGVLWCSKSEQSTKVFSAKIVFFSLKVSRYMVAAKIV